jgi:hypothetical protein
MAAVTSAGVTFNTTAGNKTVVATPAAGDLIVVIAAHSGRTTAQAPVITDNNADGFGTTAAGGYTNCTALASTKATSADSMWVFVRNRLIGSATSTTFTDTIASDSGGGLEVFRVSAMSIVGQGAIRGGGIQSNQALGTTPTPVLLRRLGVVYSGTQAALTANALISAVFNATNPAATTPRSSPAWTGSANTGYTVPAAGLRTAFINSGETASSLAWGGTSATAFCTVAFELDISVPQYDYVLRNQVDSDRIMSRDAVMRKAVW